MSKQTQARELNKLVEYAKSNHYNKNLIENYKKQLSDITERVREEKRDIEIAKYIGL